MDTVTRYEERNNTVKAGGAFTCDNVPEGVYSLGEGIYAYAVEWKKQISVHVRKFKFYGNTYFPSSTGVTLSSSVFFSLQKETFDKVRQTLEYWLQDETCDIDEEFKFHVSGSSPERTVTLMKEVVGHRGAHYITSITLTHEQWLMFEHISDCVSIDIVNIRFKEVDLVPRFNTVGQLSVIEDDKIYQDILTQYLKAAIIRILYNCGVLEFSEETENSLSLFNAACFKLDVLAVIAEFYCMISKDIISDGRNLNTCVTFKFLKELDFLQCIHNIRNEMCCLEQWV